MIRIGGLAVLLMLLVGCATIPGTYNDQQISKDIVWTTFSGRLGATREDVQTYGLYHCAKITIKRGYDVFEIIHSGPLCLMTPGEKPYKFAGQDYNSFTIQKVFWIIIPLPGSRSTAPQPRGPLFTAEIRLCKNSCAVQPPRSFNARLLKAALDRYVEGENCGGHICPHAKDYLGPTHLIEEQGECRTQDEKGSAKEGEPGI